MKLPGYLSGILLICLTLGACDSYNLSLREFFSGPSPGDSATVRLGSVADLLTYISTASGGLTAGDPIVLPPLELNLTANEMTLLLAAIASAQRYVSVDLSACTMPSPEFDPGTANTGEQYITALILPDAATSINGGFPDTTFQYFDNLKSVSGAGITEVGMSAFHNYYSNTSLTTISFPEATVIGNSAFFGCSSLTSVYLPKATVIDNSAFYRCTSLTEISLPNAATISGYAFRGCTSLTAISLPKATGIGNRAFEGCTVLPTISLPKVIAIGDSAFSGCTALASLTLGKDTAPWPVLGSTPFYNTGNSGTLTIHVPAGTVANYTATWGVPPATPANGNESKYGNNHKAIEIID